MIKERLGHGIRRFEIAAVAEMEAAPGEPADAPHRIAPGQPRRKPEFLRSFTPSAALVKLRHCCVDSRSRVAVRLALGMVFPQKLRRLIVRWQRGRDQLRLAG